MPSVLLLFLLLFLLFLLLLLLLLRQKQDAVAAACVYFLLPCPRNVWYSKLLESAQRLSQAWISDLEVCVFRVRHLLPAGRSHDVALLVSRQEPVGYGLNAVRVQAGNPMQVLAELRHPQ